MERSRNYGGARKSVVRDAVPPVGGRRTRTPPVGTGAVGAGTGTSGAGATIGDFVTKYRPYLLIGAGAIVVAIVYQVYSRRMSKRKEDEQIQTGLRSIDALGANAAGTAGATGQGGRAPLSVDPAVIEVLQQQVLDYQAQVEQLEQALNIREQQIREIQQLQQNHAGNTLQSGPGTGGTGGVGGVIHPAANGNYAGLHGQMNPNANFAPLPVQLEQPMPTRDTSVWAPNTPAGAIGNQQTMGAFSNEGGGNQDLGVMSMGQGGGSGGPSGQFTPL